MRDDADTVAVLFAEERHGAEVVDSLSMGTSTMVCDVVFARTCALTMSSTSASSSSATPAK